MQNDEGLASAALVVLMAALVVALAAQAVALVAVAGFVARTPLD